MERAAGHAPCVLHYTALVLRYYEGYDDAAIAHLLDTSETTVRSQASRGLARMRGALEPPARAHSPASPSPFIQERS